MWPFANKEQIELKTKLTKKLETAATSLSLSSQSLDRALEELHQALRHKQNE